MTTPIITHPAPSVQTCPTCSGQGSIVRGPYSHGCADCHGEGIRTEPMVRCITCWAMVPESHIADVEAQFCRDCAAAGEDVPPTTPAPDPLPDDWQAFRGLTVRDKSGVPMVWRENGQKSGYYPAGSVAA